VIHERLSPVVTIRYDKRTIVFHLNVAPTDHESCCARTLFGSDINELTNGFSASDPVRFVMPQPAVRE
jgi:hypothetical protein